MQHTNNITYTPRLAALLPRGKVYGNRVPLPLCSPPTPCPCPPAPSCPWLKLLCRCHTKFKFMTTAARWRCMCQTVCAAHFEASTGQRTGEGREWSGLRGSVVRRAGALNSDAGSGWLKKGVPRFRNNLQQNLS